jgi:hypothetical protein
MSSGSASKSSSWRWSIRSSYVGSCGLTARNNPNGERATTVGLWSQKSVNTEERLTRQTRAHGNPSTQSSSRTSRCGPGAAAQWWSPYNVECLSAQTSPPRRLVGWCSQQRWVLPTQGVENPPSATGVVRIVLSASYSWNKGKAICTKDVTYVRSQREEHVKWCNSGSCE